MSILVFRGNVKNKSSWQDISLLIIIASTQNEKSPLETTDASESKNDVIFVPVHVDPTMMPIHDHIRRKWFFGFLFVCLCCGTSLAQSSSTKRLSLLLTGNTYGYFDITPVGQELAGGIVRRKTIIEQIRREVGSEQLLLLDAGNALGYYYLLKGDRGSSMLSALRKLGYDALVVGNHEFDYGKQLLKSYSTNPTSIPLLAANLFTKGSSEPFLTPSIIIEKAGGVRVAILGLTDPAIEQLILRQHFENLTVTDPISAAQTLVPQLRQQADLVIALTHLRMDDCYRLAMTVPGIDIVIARADQSSSAPLVRKEDPDEASSTTIVSPIRYGSAVLQLDVLFDEQTKKVETVLRGHHAVNATVTGDVEFATRLAVGSEQQYYEYSRTTYGVEPDEPLLLVDESFSAQDLIQLVLNVMLQKTDTEIALLNNTFFRFEGLEFPIYELDPRYRKLTVRTLEQMLWTDNELVTMRLTGQQLSALQRQSVANKRAGRPNFLHNLQITSIGMNDWFIHNNPLLQRNPPEWYHVATTNFLAGGGDGFQTFREGRDVVSRFDSNHLLRGVENGFPVIVRDFLIRFLKRRRDETGGAVRLPLAVVDSSYRTRHFWRLTLSRLQFNYSAGQYRANSSYRSIGLTELRGTDFERITYEADVRLRQESSFLIWDNRLYAIFGRSQITGQPLQEISDDLFFETVLNLRSSKTTDAISFYPSASVRYDTEITPTESKQTVNGQTITVHNPRQKDVTIGVGVGFSDIAGFSRSRISLTQTFDQSQRPRPDENGINLQTSYQLSLGAALFRSELDGTYYIKQKKSSGDTRRLLVRLRGDVAIPLGRFTLAPSIYFFVFQGQQSPEPGHPPPIATALVAGITLGYSFDWKMQYESLF